MTLVKHFMNALPYLPLHCIDTRFCNTPKSTGTGYFQRFSTFFRTDAYFARNKVYALRPTSKGYFFNTVYKFSHTWLHHIKTYGFPFVPSNSHSDNLRQLRIFFQKYGTMLFTCNHISDRDGKLKQRPVYAADDFFILVELMLTFPLHVMARYPINGIKCCMMYGLETIRGSNILINSVAQRFTSFFTMDWFAFDQTVSWLVTDIFFLEYLPSLIVINKGYQPTYEYPTYPDLSEHALYDRMSKTLQFMHTWYNCMVYITADSFAYLRQHAGVPSGILNTQYIDSFCNLFILIDGLLEYGFTPEQIYFFEYYTKHCYNMTFSRLKSLITMMRNKIQTLSYTCNFGKPRRPLSKLVTQLCYPEHGPKDKYMSAHAIGLAYAAAGMDLEFHEFCRDIYTTFLPYAAPLDDHSLDMASKHLPGYFKILDSLKDKIPFDHFPTIDEVCAKYSTWQGFLKPEPKWNFSHFINHPEIIPPDAKTMADYRAEHTLEAPLPFTHDEIFHMG
ncbi:DNA/RNA polymerase [Choiromyces venosus 120613-1]|uniref:DNA/RNA polymerase n=1 Tax=Choiromyces venosus 120613-1 TaxID=1336337 RepID=A0A3N4J9N4_9PEZI|nr:DNA/RNA polymerase [Choiromyces venosus 120613-1]